jgi:hypothetical protein
MRPKQLKAEPQEDLFRARLENREISSDVLSGIGASMPLRAVGVRFDHASSYRPVANNPGVVVEFCRWW